MTQQAILCIDDEPIILDGLKEQLKRRFGNRFIYEVAGNADEAWDVIDELEEFGVKILIIISDWLMPGIKGDEFLIAVHQKFPAIVTVMLTGQADEAAITRAREQAKLFACLQKPWTEDQLANIITSVVN